jgi:hypothetical protein
VYFKDQRVILPLATLRAWELKGIVFVANEGEEECWQVNCSLETIADILDSTKNPGVWCINARKQTGDTTMNGKEIITDWLRQNGYDGLFDECCACLLDDLIPCVNECALDCMAGYEIPCPDPENCDYGNDKEHYHMTEKKPSPPEAKNITKELTPGLLNNCGNEKPGGQI